MWVGDRGKSRGEENRGMVGKVGVWVGRRRKGREKGEEEEKEER